MLCKICECGVVLKFEKAYLCPDPCPSCGRITQSYTTYFEDDPSLVALVNKYKKCDQEHEHSARNTESRYALVSSRKGYEIRIPDNGCVIGRTEFGATELADNPAVSKKNIVVNVNKKFGLFIEDISSFGTSINGKRILKGEKIHVNVGDEIVLYDEEFVVKEG